MTTAPRHVLLSPNSRRPRNCAPPSSGRLSGLSRSNVRTGACASAAPSTGRNTQMASILRGLLRAVAQEADQLGIVGLEPLDGLARARAEVDHGALVPHAHRAPQRAMLLPALENLYRGLLHHPIWFPKWPASSPRTSSGTSRTTPRASPSSSPPWPPRRASR